MWQGPASCPGIQPIPIPLQFQFVHEHLPEYLQIKFHLFWQQIENLSPLSSNNPSWSYIHFEQDGKEMINADVTWLLHNASSVMVISIASFELSCNLIVKISSWKIQNFNHIKFLNEFGIFSQLECNWNLVNYPSQTGSEAVPLAMT